MQTSDVEYQADGRRMIGYLAVPDEDGDNADQNDAPDLPKARPQQRADDDEDSTAIDQDRGPVR